MPKMRRKLEHERYRSLGRRVERRLLADASPADHGRSRAGLGALRGTEVECHLRSHRTPSTEAGSHAGPVLHRQGRPVRSWRWCTPEAGAPELHAFPAHRQCAGNEPPGAPAGR